MIISNKSPFWRFSFYFIMHNQTSNLQIYFKTLQIARKTIPAFRFVPVATTTATAMRTAKKQ